VLSFDKSTSRPIPFPIATNIIVSDWVFGWHHASRAITVALIIETVEHYLSTNSVLFWQTLIHYCWSNRNSPGVKILGLRYGCMNDSYSHTHTGVPTPTTPSSRQLDLCPRNGRDSTLKSQSAGLSVLQKVIVELILLAKCTTKHPGPIPPGAKKETEFRSASSPRMKFKIIDMAPVDFGTNSTIHGGGPTTLAEDLGIAAPGPDR